MEAGFGDRVHQSLLDSHVLSEELGFKRFLPKLRFAEYDVPVSRHKGTIAGAVPMSSAVRCPLMPICSGLLERFQLHHEVQKPRDNAMHAFTLVGKMFFDSR